MTPNIHPLFVHFPIALLFLYSIVKVIPFHRWFPKVAWRHIERVLLVIGVLGAFAASYTGEIAEHIVKPQRDLVEMHSLFADFTTWIFGALLLGEILSLLMPVLITRLKSPKFISFCLFIQKILTHRVFSRILAILGFIAITVTGLLGGTMVYGLTADPIAPLVLKILGITLQ